MTKIPGTLRSIIVVMILTGTSVISRSQETDTIIPVEKDPYKLLRKIDLKNISDAGFNLWQDKFSGHWA